MDRARRDRGSSTSKPDAANGAKPPTGSTTRVRQSVLYSVRRGPRGRKGRPVEEHTGEVSSSELGHRSADLSQFDALTLNTTPPTLQSSDRVEEHSTEVRSTEPNGTGADLSKDEGISLNVTSPGYESTDGAVVHGSNMDIGVPDSTIEKQPAVQEALSPRSEERRRKINQYLAEHTFDDILEAMVAVKNGFCNPPKKVSNPKKSSEKLALPDSPESPHRLDTQSSQTKIQCGESTKQITKNGKLWMEKEVMKAFKKCIIVREGLRGVEFELDELLHQCFSVEAHDKMFHHYNFTVRMKEAGSDKWSSSTLYFAQVKEMYGRKFYFCYPLDPNEDDLKTEMPSTAAAVTCGTTVVRSDSNLQIRDMDDHGCSWTTEGILFPSSSSADGEDGMGLPKVPLSWVPAVPGSCVVARQQAHRSTAFPIRTVCVSTGQWLECQTFRL